jgi:hypothetical protein
LWGYNYWQSKRIKVINKLRLTNRFKLNFNDGIFYFRCIEEFTINGIFRINCKFKRQLVKKIQLFYLILKGNFKLQFLILLILNNYYTITIFRVKLTFDFNILNLMLIGRFDFLFYEILYLFSVAKFNRFHLDLRWPVAG